jgi:hypothetical protein
VWNGGCVKCSLEDVWSVGRRMCEVWFRGRGGCTVFTLVVGCVESEGKSMWGVG